MANTKDQKKRIRKDLYSPFIHPSPALSRKWEKRRKEKGNGQDVLDQEFNEWIREGENIKRLKRDYETRLTNELWNNPIFRKDILKARKIYLKNIELPIKQQDEKCLGRLNNDLSKKYGLNFGWLLWLTNCIEKEENDPKRLFLYLIRKKDDKGKYLSLEVYFPLPEPIYNEAINYMRMKEPEVFGDYYSQTQKGGRPKRSRPQKVVAKYNRIINNRNSVKWRSKTDKEFLDYHTEVGRSELARAKRWEREGKPR